MIKTDAVLLDSHFDNKMVIGAEIGWVLREYNPSTGYVWRCMSDNSGVYELVERIILHSPSNVIGVPGMSIWKFSALREGKGIIKFVLIQQGEEDPVEEVTIKITVIK